MSFSVDWLGLRAGFDTAARARDLERGLAAWAADRVAATGRPLAVVDLGAGSGNNRRHLAPRLGVEQAWTLVDADAGLLDAARRADPTVAVRQVDLARDLDAAFPADADLVTASALLDLVSEAWLERLLKRVAGSRAALLMVLTYDGRTVWQPSDPLDDRVLDLVNRHQRTDKGFGRALGPDAAPTLARLAGGRALQAGSDWVVEAGDDAMRAALVHGWADAATAMAPGEAAAIESWRVRSAARPARLVVGHLDQLLTPAA